MKRTWWNRWLRIYEDDKGSKSHHRGIFRFFLRALGVAITILTLWLFAHFYLTSRHDVTPWKLGAMAMYVETGPTYQLDWYQRFGEQDRRMVLSDRDRDELFQRHSSPAQVLSYGTLIGMAESAEYLMATRLAPYPIIAVVQRRKHWIRRSRYIDRSCRYEFIYVDGEMIQNRVCRSVDEAVVDLGAENHHAR